MASISDNDYHRILEVDQLGYGTLPPTILEKDLLIVKTLGLLQAFDWGECVAVFCGGTSLSKGYGLIERMSEDIDFKLLLPQSTSQNQARKGRRKLRRELAEYLCMAGFRRARRSADPPSSCGPPRDACGKGRGILAPHGHLARQWLAQEAASPSR